MKPISVLVVDDSALIRQMFSEMLSEEADIRVLGTASDPYDAREKIKQLNPDVLTLDIEMPKMDGLSFLEKIMALRPMPVIMISSLTQRGADATIRALEMGAVDTIGKPAISQTRNTIQQLKGELVTKIRAAANAHMAPRNLTKSGSAAIIPFRAPRAKEHQLIAIGSSTGGVEALRDIFQRLPANAPPIVIAQHMPALFTPSFAARLDSLSAMRVVQAENHMRLQPGHAYVAPGGMHLRVVRVGKDLVCKLDDGETVSGHKPSVDVLFQSVAAAAPGHAVGVILTGMGKDGADGLKLLHDAGGFTIGQNRESCVVYGMPMAAAKLGALDCEIPLSEIAEKILQYCEKGEAS